MMTIHRSKPQFERLLENLVDFLAPPEVMSEEEVDDELRRAGLCPEEVGKRLKDAAERTIMSLEKEEME